MRYGVVMWRHGVGADKARRTVKPDATPEEVQQVLETENPQIFSQAVSTRHSSYFCRTLRCRSDPTAPKLEPIRRRPRRAARDPGAKQRHQEDRTHPDRVGPDVQRDEHVGRTARRDDRHDREPRAAGRYRHGGWVETYRRGRRQGEEGEEKEVDLVSPPSVVKGVQSNCLCADVRSCRRIVSGSRCSFWPSSSEW